MRAEWFEFVNTWSHIGQPQPRRYIPIRGVRSKGSIERRAQTDDRSTIINELAAKLVESVLELELVCVFRLLA